MLTFKEYQEISEAAYAGNIGVMELIRFYEKATPEIVNRVKNLIAKSKNKEALDIVQQTLGVKLHPSVCEATYQGREVKLNNPMPGDVKKSKVYVDPDGDGEAKKVEFGDPNMTIKKNDPERRKSFRARHGCDDPDVPKPKDKARYWSCKAW